MIAGLKKLVVASSIAAALLAGATSTAQAAED